ncbi:MAG: methylenetetrahydrofolate reductase [Verrucomicrobiota bacterium]|jgi:methylenetetrahydrofolate reductase (NADPH)|nr:methylenetetrahydrofolate reductase [Verrucomicrobiota bacterium]
MSLPTISEILQSSRAPTLSLEFYPPKDALGFGVLGSSIERMRPVHPDFVTGTYGAGGSTRDNSFAVWELLGRMGFTPVVAHLTCVGAARSDLLAQIDRIYDAGIRNIMALRGDPPRGEACFVPPEDGLAHAADLVALIKSRHPDICCGVAGYPETHPESRSPEEDIHFLKQKVEAGAQFINTQLFFDNRVFFRFEKACREAGITVPILPGLMPAASPTQLRRSVELSCATIPQDLVDGLENAPTSAMAREFGMQWLVDQIDGLIAGGAAGVHLYILNQAKTILDPNLAACLARWRAPSPVKSNIQPERTCI